MSGYSGNARRFTPSHDVTYNVDDQSNILLMAKLKLLNICVRSQLVSGHSRVILRTMCSHHPLLTLGASWYTYYRTNIETVGISMPVTWSSSYADHFPSWVILVHLSMRNVYRNALCMQAFISVS